jgi:hypothetical protein
LAGGPPMGENKRLPWWALRCRYHVWREVRSGPWSSYFETSPLYRWMGSNRFRFSGPDRPWSHAVFNHLFLKLAQSRPNLEKMDLHWCPRDLDILTSFSKLTQLSIARGDGVDASGLAKLPQLGDTPPDNRQHYDTPRRVEVQQAKNHQTPTRRHTEVDQASIDAL